MRNVRVVYWNNIPAPYNVARFNALARRGNLDFEAWFNERQPSERSWDVEESTWEFRYRYLPSVGLHGRGMNLPWPLIGSNPPDLLVSLYGEPGFLLGWSIARRRGIRTAFWSEVTFDRWVQRRRWKEAIKRYIFPRADGIITVDADGRDFARRYGAREDRIFFAPHAIDAQHFIDGREAGLAERERMRRELGIRGLTFINVGRWWWGKGLDHLLDAFAVLQRRLEGEVSLLLVGDGPEERRLRQRCAEEGLRNVVLLGFQQQSELPRYYTMADVFVFPTLGDPYGMVINEAMACSLPIITTTAAGEAGYRVEDGVNGFYVPPANSAALLDRMEALARDPALRQQMGEASLARIRHEAPECWAIDFERSVDAILSRPPVAADERA
jgi:glycosyltransferase involved in cell wall biosynthesis